MKLRLTTLLVLCSILVGCTEEYSGVVLKRGGLLYKPNSTEPLTARVEQFHDNGRLHKTYTSVDGKKEGLERWWYDNGQLDAEKCYRAGELTDMAYCEEQTK